MLMRKSLIGSIGVSLVAINCGSEATPTEAGPLPDVYAALSTANQGVNFSILGGHVRPRFDGSAAVAARVDLSSVANGAFEITSEHEPSTRFHLAVTPIGAAAAPARVEAGLVHYGDAFGPGTDTIHRVTVSGTEDYVRFPVAPAKAELRYKVAIGEDIAGLRLVSNSLEFLDAQGAPRLRVAPPYGVDARGERFAARLNVEGCYVEADPRPSWGRTPVAAGASECVVTVTWDARVAYPAVIDPAWSGTNSPTAYNPTHEDFLVRLSGGKALYVSSLTAELFDPATNTWASTGAPTFNFTHRSRLVAGASDNAWGIYSGGSASSLYSLTAGLWVSTATKPLDSDGVALQHLGGNQVLVVDAAGSTYIYDAVANTYTTKNPAGQYLGGNTGVFALGGTKFGVLGWGSRVAIFDMLGNGGWTFPVSQILPEGPSNCGNLEPLTNGKILAYGACGAENTARLFDPATDTVTPVAIDNSQNLHCQCAHTSSVAYGTRHLIGGGRYLYDEGTGIIKDLGAFPSGAVQHGAIVKLLDGRALSAGGSVTYNNHFADLYTASNSADCASGFGTAATPVFDASSKLCKACDADNGVAKSLPCPSTDAPACQTGAQNALVGQCTACSATNRALCTGTTSTCDLTTGMCAACTAGYGVAGAVRACPTAASPVCAVNGSCTIANGDHGTAASAPCPTAANPSVQANGTCGKCTTNAECAGSTHGGPLCNAATGTCSTVCAQDTDCLATQFCDASGAASVCSVKKPDSIPCAVANECSTGACTEGRCGKPSVPYAGTGTSDAGTAGNGATPGSGANLGSGATPGSAAAGSDSSGCSTSSHGFAPGSSSSVFAFGLSGIFGLALRARRQRRKAHPKSFL
jgi:MYXO-CTERM domain-containing protein